MNRPRIVKFHEKNCTPKSKFVINYGTEGTYRFTARGKRMVDLASDFMLIQADIVLADGTQCEGIVGLDPSSSFEHWTTHIFLTDGIASQGHDDFCKMLGRTKKEVYPYRYKYRVRSQIAMARFANDHHVDDETGWST